MTLTVEEFQKAAKPWLAKLKATGEPLFLLSDSDSFEVRPAEPAADGERLRKFENLFPERDLIVGDPDDLVHMDWSKEWRPCL